MTDMVDIQEYFPYEETLFLKAELYLPKNLENQAAIIQILKEAIHFESAIKWLKNNASDICSWHGMPEPFSDYHTLESIIDKMDKTIYGYSIYESDGCFWSCTDPHNIEYNRTAKDVRVNKNTTIPIIEERSMIIRFLCNIAKNFDEHIPENSSDNEIASYIKRRRETLQEPDQKKITDSLTMIKGFITHRITTEVFKEDEVWLELSRVKIYRICKKNLSAPSIPED